VQVSAAYRVHPAQYEEGEHAAALRPGQPGFPPGAVNFGAHAAAELDPDAGVRQSFSKLTPAG
jgi:hypothetical protein